MSKTHHSLESIQNKLFSAVISDALDSLEFRNQSQILTSGYILPEVNTAGATTSDMLQLLYKKRKLPVYPFEEIKSKR